VPRVEDGGGGGGGEVEGCSLCQRFWGRGARFARQSRTARTPGPGISVPRAPGPACWPQWPAWWAAQPLCRSRTEPAISQTVPPARSTRPGARLRAPRRAHSPAARRHARSRRARKRARKRAGETVSVSGGWAGRVAACGVPSWSHKQRPTRGGGGGSGGGLCQGQSPRTHAVEHKLRCGDTAHTPARHGALAERVQALHHRVAARAWQREPATRGRDQECARVMARVLVMALGMALVLDASRHTWSQTAINSMCGRVRASSTALASDPPRRPPCILLLLPPSAPPSAHWGGRG